MYYFMPLPRITYLTDIVGVRHTAYTLLQYGDYSSYSPAQGVFTLPGLTMANQFVYHPILVTAQDPILFMPY